MADPPTREEERLVRELVSLRQRGIDRVDYSDRRQKPLALPTIEALGSQPSPTDAGDRAAAVRAWLDDALADYSAMDETGASFVRRLFFDAAGHTPGPGGPKDLLDAARTVATDADPTFSEKRFRSVQRDQFRLFARHCLSRALERPAEPGRRRTAWIRAAIGAGLIVLAAATWTVARATLGDDEPGPTSPPSAATRTSAAPPPPTAKLTFDNLGSSASKIIDVYPGVRANVHDRTKNGTFITGNVVVAVCVTTGRPVTSDPHAGETARSSDVWVRIAAVPHTVQYATFTYARLSVPVSRMPRCHGVG